MKVRILLLLVLIPGVAWVYGQDIHFSQVTASPLLLNPALTGFFSEQLRVGLNYRNQGATISVPYKTYAASVDGVLQPTFIHDDFIGVGCVAFNDNAGDGSLQQSSVMLSGAYHKGLSRFGNLNGAVGVALGLVNRSVDYSKLVFGNQWNGVQFDPNAASNENYSTSSFLYLDLNVGVLLSYKVQRTAIISAGLSLNHINKPRDSFYKGADQVGWKWIAHGSGDVKLDDHWFLESGITWYLMNKISELTLGGNLHYTKGEIGIAPGLWYRVGSDIIVMAGLDYHRYSLLFSYDVNVSSLRKASKSVGGFEVSVVKKFIIPRKNRSCENFRFL